VFAEGEDLTVGLEEEFQILDGGSLELTSRYADLKNRADELFGQPLVFSELIQSEAEINSRKSETFAGAREDVRRKRAVLGRAADELGLAVCSSGVHPFSDWREQRFIDSPHYEQVVERLQYVAWTNNTFGLHVHVGVRGADRAIRIHDAYRSYLPGLLALSASSPFYLGRDTGLHSTRAQVFMRAFPRCGIPDAYGDWAKYAEYAQLLYDTNSVSEPTQIWWTLRAHHTYGTLEIRATDAQPDFRDSMALAAFAVALVADLLDRDDRGEALRVDENRYLEENRWRALRYGLEGRMIDLERRVEVATVEFLRRLLEDVSGVAARLSLEDDLARVEKLLKDGNSAQRQLALYRDGVDIPSIHRLNVEETMALAREAAA
jgi:carboxylate-amine ligase